jgi:hypothetical protein
LHRAVKPQPRFGLRTRIDSSGHEILPLAVPGPRIRASFAGYSEHWGCVRVRSRIPHPNGAA